MRHEFLDFMWRHAAMFNGYKRKMISNQFLLFDAHKQVCAFFFINPLIYSVRKWTVKTLQRIDYLQWKCGLTLSYTAT